jgi:acyl-CoA thioesterase I
MSKIIRFLPLCALSLNLFATLARAEPRKPTHVACVGDSITAGSGASDASKNYVSLLQGLLGNTVQVKNFGHSGATLLSAGFGDLPYNMQSEYTGATDFVSSAGAGSVVSVVIMLGTNDSKPYNWEPANKPKNDQQYLTDYRAMVDHFAGLPTKPVVYVAYPLATGTNPCCSIRGEVIHDQELPLIKQLAMEKHVPIIDLNTATLNHPEYFGDGVHPTDAGYVVMANLVKKGLDREPTVSITSPSMGAMLAAGMLQLTADASGDTVDIASVEFFEGATSLGKVTTKPFTLMWTATPGAHAITAKAIDTTLASAISPLVMFGATPGAVGGAGGGGSASGGAGGASAGAASGGTGTAGTGTAGTGTAGSSVMAGGAAGTATSTGGSGSTMLPTTPASGTSTDPGCSCAVPGSSSQESGGWSFLVLGASLLSLRQRRRRAA